MFSPLRSTARLQLSRLTLDDIDAFVDLETELRRRRDPAARPPDRAVLTEYLARFSDVWEAGSLGYWTIRYSGEVAGFGGVKPKRWRGSDCWNLYYRLYPHLMGLGLATEMAREAVIAASEELPRRSVLVETRPSNTPAIAVAERAGLTRRPDLDRDGWAVLLLDRSAPQQRRPMFPRDYS